MSRKQEILNALDDAEIAKTLAIRHYQAYCEDCREAYTRE